MAKKSDVQQYWEDRYLDIKKAQLSKAKKYEKEYKRRLKETQKEIEKEINSFVKKYASADGTISASQAKKILTGKDLQGWKQDLAEWERMAKSGSYKQQMDMQYFESRVSRLRAIQSQVANIMAKQTARDDTELASLLKDTYKDTYYRNIYTTQSARGKFASNFSKVNENELDAIIRSGWKGANFSERLWGNQVNDLPKALTSSLFRGMALGYSGDRLVQLVKQQLGADYQSKVKGQLHKLVLTESAYITEQATMASYTESGVEKYEWLATLESHTCDECAHLDGKVFPVKSGNVPPAHPYCRCTTIPAMGDNEYARMLDGVEETRWSKNPFTDEVETVGNMTYPTWAKTNNLLDEAQKAEPKITSDLSVSLNGTNAKFEGLDYRLKTFDSLARKVSNEPDKNMRDVVRYTAISKPDELVSEYQVIMENLAKKGYNVSAVKNSWIDPTNAYNGVNTNLISPTGYEFELQFHTQDSFDMKQTKQHTPYEEQRTLAKYSERWWELQEQMLEMAKSLKVPKNIERIGKHGN
jgi:SPP1 gp7 family putative phage head morphogenesis protein